MKNRIVKIFERAYEVAKKRNFDRLFVGVDIHETVLKPTWSKELSKEYYKYAKEALKLMSNRSEICLILWSCSLPEFNKQYSNNFKEDGIIFDYINENPECPSTDYADFDMKLYFSVGLDDKFGFLPEEDWIEIYEFFYKKKLIEENDNLTFEELGELNPIISCNYLNKFTTDEIKNFKKLNIPNFHMEDNGVYFSFEKDIIKGLITKSDKNEYLILYGEGSFHKYTNETIFYKSQTVDGVSDLLKIKFII